MLKEGKMKKYFKILSNNKNKESITKRHTLLNLINNIISDNIINIKNNKIMLIYL